MNAPGGGTEDLGELLRRLGPDPLVRELEAAGLSIRGDRCRCPFQGCADGGKERRRDVQIYRTGKPHVACFKCLTTGDLVDVLQATRRITADEARAQVRGQPAPIRPPLQLVTPPATLEDPDKDRIKPEEVRTLWKALALSDAEGEKYLEGRCLEDGVALGLVRFATVQHPDKRVTGHARRGYRIALQLTDVVGNPRGVIIRLARRAKDKTEDSYMSVKGSSPGRGFIGSPDLIESAPIVCVTEGGADTLAVASWTAGRKGIATAGASGTSNLPKLAKELEAAGISVAGKLFLLFTQNDLPKNKSRRAFETLRQRLLQLGARAFHVPLDREFKDVAEWLEKHPDAEWPPEEVRSFFEFPEEDEAAKPAPASPFAAVLADQDDDSIHFAKNFTTLVKLFRDPGHREAVFGRAGELTQSEMTHMVHVGGLAIEETDLSVLRHRIEGYARSTDADKPISFTEEDIGKALKVVGRQRTIHPPRDWLLSLKWDGVARIDLELPAALGQREGSFACVMLSRWMISAVARPLKPGCKVDTVLVLIGGQGIGKSTFFNLLAGDEWFTDSPVNVGDKDGKMLMRKKWIVEWAELDAMRRARDKEATRAFISARTDDFREPYGRGLITAPRSCIIVGTTNDPRFLHDKERRFLPVQVASVDLAWLTANREQLLAEAVHRFRAGEPWHFTREELDELYRLQEDHQVENEWVSVVQDWVAERDLEYRSTIGVERLTAARVSDVLESAIGKPPGQWVDGKDTNKAAEALRKLGWTGPRRCRVRVKGASVLGYWWFRPGFENEVEPE